MEARKIKSHEYICRLFMVTIIPHLTSAESKDRRKGKRFQSVGRRAKYIRQLNRNLSGPDRAGASFHFKILEVDDRDWVMVRSTVRAVSRSRHTFPGWTSGRPWIPQRPRTTRRTCGSIPFFWKFFFSIFLRLLVIASLDRSQLPASATRLLYSIRARLHAREALYCPTTVQV